MEYVGYVVDQFSLSEPLRTDLREGLDYKANKAGRMPRIYMDECNSSSACQVIRILDIMQKGF